MIVGKDSPLVSIVTPTYNQAEYLVETIESVLNQDYPNIEYIILNDGSTDNTEEILKQYDGRIHWASHKNCGQSATLNKGWSIAQGKYLGYLSSDDILDPTAVSRLVQELENNNQIVCVYPNADLIDENSNTIKENICKEFNREDLIISQECYIGPGALFRSEVYQLIGGWKPQLKLAPDREFWMRLSAFGPFYFDEKVLAYYRLHSQSISYQGISEAVSREYLDVLDHYFASDNIPEHILKRKKEAYGKAKFIIARNCFREWNLRRGFKMYIEAYHDYPELKRMKYIFQFIKNIVSKPIRLLLAKIKAYSK